MAIKQVMLNLPSDQYLVIKKIASHYGMTISDLVNSITYSYFQSKQQE